MSKLTKIREILFENSDYVFGDIKLRYGKEKSVYLTIESKQDCKQQHFFVLSDVNYITTANKELCCFCELKLIDGTIIKVSGENKQIENLYDNLHRRWLETKISNRDSKFIKSTIKLGGAVLVFVMLSLIVFNTSNVNDKSEVYMPDSIKKPLDIVTPPVMKNDILNNGQEEDLLALKIAQQAKPNPELSSLLKKGAATNDYSVKLGHSTDEKSIFYVFSDPLCPHCRNIEPILEKLADDHMVHIFPVSKIGREKSKSMVETVLCSRVEARELSWKNAISDYPDVANPCQVGETALANNDATFSAFSFIGTPTVIRNDGAVFPLTTKLNEENLKKWIKEGV